MNPIQKPEGFESQKLFVVPEFVTKDIAGHELTRALYVTDIGYFPQARYHYRERMNGCDSHIFILCSEGEGWVQFNGDQPIRLPKQTMVVIPADTPHRYGAADREPWSIYWFHLKGDHVSEFIDSFDLFAGPLQIPTSSYIQFVEKFNQCYEILTLKPYSQLEHIYASQTMRYLLSLLGMFSGRSAKDKKKEQLIEVAVRYMNEHLDDSIKLPQLAKYTGLSKQHFIHLFKEATGFPPIDYYLRMKMQRACQILDLTDRSVKEVCGMLGIQDPYYFSRLFKKMIGCSPTEYRNIQKG